MFHGLEPICNVCLILCYLFQNPIPTNRPGVEPKRPPRPVNISPLVKLSPTVANHITVTWASDYTRQYVIAVHLVKKLSSTELLQKMKSKGVRHSDFTRGLSMPCPTICQNFLT